MSLLESTDESSPEPVSADEREVVQQEVPQQVGRPAVFRVNTPYTTDMGGWGGRMKKKFGKKKRQGKKGTAAGNAQRKTPKRKNTKKKAVKRTVRKPKKANQPKLRLTIQQKKKAAEKAQREKRQAADLQKWQQHRMPNWITDSDLEQFGCMAEDLSSSFSGGLRAFL